MNNRKKNINKDGNDIDEAKRDTGMNKDGGLAAA